MALGIGSMLAGRYEITAPIATGGMGEVWKARDRVLDRIVAAKVLKTEYTNDPSFLARFRNEARHTAALTHPNIASVYDYGETTDDSGVQTLAFLVMEYVEGQPLVTILHEEGRLPVDWTLHVLGQAADGLSAAHRAGVVHRDIKPGNLIVRPDGVVKLTDFGIAQARDAAPLTRTGMVVGTAQYLSPEQAQGMEVTAASDVYSLGVVGFECLSGARPFDGASQVAIALAHINRPPPPLPGDVPPAVRLLVERALAKDPADRFTDGGAFAEAVRRVAAGDGLAAGPVVAPATTPTQIVEVGDGHTQVFATPAAGMPAVSPATGGRPMPPLQQPPEDDYWAGEDEPPARRSRGWLWPAVALVLLLIVAGTTFVLLNSGGEEPRDDTAAPTSAAPTSAETGGILLDPAQYVGRDADEVEEQLREAGFTSISREDASEGLLVALGQTLDEGDVAGIDPAGVEATPDTEITLFVAPDDYDPAPDEGDEGGDDGEAPAPTTTTAPPTTTAPTTTQQTTTAPTTSQPTTSSPTSPAQGSPAPTTTTPPPGTESPAPDTEAGASASVAPRPGDAQ